MVTKVAAGLGTTEVTNKMKKVCFLDFDNVLNDDETKDWIKPGPGLFVDGHIGLDADKVQRLNRLLDPDTSIVFSTSWRKFYSDLELLGILNGYGFSGSLHPEAPRTPLRFSYTSRESQIQDWLEDARDDGYLPESFVVLDDLSTKYVGLDRHVQTYGDEGGFSEKKLAEALRILGVLASPKQYGFEDPEED